MKLPYLLLLLFAAVNVSAQNLLSNGNFEQYTICPNGAAQANQCVGWYAYDNSPDYFNVCGTGVGNAPNARFGYQQPASGNAYMGLYCFLGGGAKYREFLVTAIPPMQVGVAYEVSVSISLANQIQMASNEIGVLFYDKGPTTFPINGNPTGIPQIMFTSQGPITDTQNWVRVTQTFVADSAYDYMVIGAFKDWPAITPLDTVRILPGGINSYYYIDSIVVKPADGVYFTVTDSLLCAGDSVIIPFVANNFSLANTFNLQLSDATGSFASFTTIATFVGNTSGVLRGIVPMGVVPGTSYKLRIVSTSPAKTVVSPVTIDIGNIRPIKPIATGSTTVCGGGTLSLNASTPSAGIVWDWSGPNGFSSNAQAPTITNFTQIKAGDYIVTARNFGCEAKDTITVAYQAPLSLTASNSGPVCVGSDFILTANTATPGVTFSWTGPNGFTSSLQNPTIIGAAANAGGVYTVTATLNACTNTKTTTVVVNAPIPVKPVATGNSTVCGGGTLSLNATTPSTGITWEWSGPSGFSANIQAPQVTNFSLAKAGDYIVTAKNGVCSSKDTITVGYQAPISLTASNTGPACEGTGFTLNASSSTPGLTYSWTGPNGFTSSLQNPSRAGATVSMSGDYTVTATLNACTASQTTSVGVFRVPVASAATTGPVCAGGTLNLSATSSLTGSTYQWSGPAGFTSTQQSPAISGATLSNNGTYTVIAKKDGCSSAPAAVQATVLLTPAMPTASNTGPVCSGVPASLKANSTTAGVSYSWTGPGFNSNAQNPTIANTSMANAGVYTVTATLGSCSSAPAHTMLSITERPTVGAYVSPNDTVCSDASPFFQAFPKNQGNTPQYQWYRNNQPIPGATQTMYTATGLNNGDIIKFVVLAAGTACTDPVNSNDIPMTIIPVITNPKVTIVTEPAMPVSPWQTVVFNAKIDHIGSKTTYQWRLNGVDVFGANAASWSTFNLRAGDKVTVMVHTDNPCADIDSALSDGLTIQHRTGIDNSNANTQLNIYPNPNNGNFSIEGINTNTAVKLDIINTLGQSVYNSELKANNGKINLSAPELAPGTYLLKLSYAGEQQIIKFSIE
jgi:hypothetical protein